MTLPKPTSIITYTLLHDFILFRDELKKYLAHPEIGDKSLTIIEVETLNFPSAKNVIALIGTTGLEILRLELSNQLKAYIDSTLSHKDKKTEEPEQSREEATKEAYGEHFYPRHGRL